MNLDDFTVTSDEPERLHTPWIIEHDGGTAEEFGSVYVRAPSGEPICEVHGQIDNPLDSEITEEEQLAHARLIAAAPDLLAACECVVEALNGPLPVEPANIVALLAGAIHKATHGD